jgi:DNA repair photolyase
VDVRTSPVERRIAAIDDFVEAGYEVNLNFGPVIFEDGWLGDYAELFGMLDAALSPAAKAQLAAEVIFLTHTEDLHNVNLPGTQRGRRPCGGPTCRSTRPRRRAASGCCATSGT